MAVVEAIQTHYLEADVSSVTFSSLGSYEHLQLRICAKTDRTDASNSDVALNFNGDGGSNYSYFRMIGSEAAASVDKQAGYTYIKMSSIQAGAVMSGAVNYGAICADILDYRNVSMNTSVRGTSGINRIFSSLLGGSRAIVFSGLWVKTGGYVSAAVTSIVLTPLGGSNFTRGSVFTLYGIQE